MSTPGHLAFKGKGKERVDAIDEYQDSPRLPQALISPHSVASSASSVSFRPARPRSGTNPNSPLSDGNVPLDDFPFQAPIPTDSTDEKRDILALSEAYRMALQRAVPQGYQLMYSLKNNDGVFDAIAQGFNHLSGDNIPTEEDKFTVKSLRQKCADFVTHHKADWLSGMTKHKYGPDQVPYLAVITDTEEDIAENRRKNVRPKIGQAIKASDNEVRMLCASYGVSIHWLEIHEDGHITEKLTTAEDGTINLEPGLNHQKYSDVRRLHLVRSGEHVVPLINDDNYSKLDLTQSGSELTAANSQGGEKEKATLDRSKRNSGLVVEPESLKNLRTLLKSEKSYHDVLRVFAQDKVVGKKAEKPKSNLQKAWAFCFGDDNNFNNIPAIWNEIRELIAVEHREKIKCIDDFLSFYFNLDSEKNTIFSQVTTEKVIMCWAPIKEFLDTKKENPLLEEKLMEMDSFIQAATKKSIKGAWARLKSFVINNKLMKEEDFADLRDEHNNHVRGLDTLVSICSQLSTNRTFEVSYKLKEFGYHNLADEEVTPEKYEQWIDKVVTVEKFDRWIDLVHDTFCGVEMNGRQVPCTFQTLTFPGMNAIGEICYTLELMKDSPLKKLYAVLREHKEHILKEDKALLNDFSSTGKEEQVESYLNAAIQAPHRRLTKIHNVLIDIKKALVAEKKSHDKVDKIISQIASLRSSAEEKSKALSHAQAGDAALYQPGKDFTQHRLSPEVFKKMAKLSTLINCWRNNDLGQSIIDQVRAKYVAIIEKADKDIELNIQHHEKSNDIRQKLTALINADRISIEHINNAIGNLGFNAEQIGKLQGIMAQRVATLKDKADLELAIEKAAAQKSSEQHYVDELQFLIDQLFTDNTKDTYVKHVGEQIDDKIHDILTRLDSTDSVFCNSLRDLKSQWGSGAVSFSSKFPRSIYVNSYISDIHITAEKKPAATKPAEIKVSEKKSADKKSVPQTPKRGPARNRASVYLGSHIPAEIAVLESEVPPPVPMPQPELTIPATPEEIRRREEELRPEIEKRRKREEMQNKRSEIQTQHLVRLSIINRVKEFFTEFDIKVQKSYFRPASDSIQTISYQIQKELHKLAGKETELLARDYDEVINKETDKSATEGGKETVSGLKEPIELAILKIMSSQLTIAGTLKESYLEGLFGKTLNEVTNYLKLISSVDDSPQELYIANTLPQKIETSISKRTFKKMLLEFTANTLMITDIKLGTGLGLQLAKRAHVKFRPGRHKKAIQKMAESTEQMISNGFERIMDSVEDDEAEAQAKQLLVLMLDGLKRTITNDFPEFIHPWIPKTDNSRTCNELIALYNHFAGELNLELLEKRDCQRFVNYEQIVDYRMSSQDAHKYIWMHMAQSTASPMLEYAAYSDTRSLVETAVSKEQTNAEILAEINKIYSDPKHKEKDRKALKAGYRNTVGLIKKTIQEKVIGSLSSPAIYQQGQFGKALKKSTEIQSESIFWLFPNPAKFAATPNSNPGRDSLYLLASRLLSLSHYYRNTEIGEQICKKYGISPNKNAGQSDKATEIAEFALEMFLEEESEQEQNIIHREVKSARRLTALKNKMKSIIEEIRGDGSLVDDIFYSPNSRFALALNELLPVKERVFKEEENQAKLLFTTQQNEGLFNNSDYAKHFIRRVVIQQSLAPFVELEKKVMGQDRQGTGEAQQVAARKIHEKLSALTAMDMESCEAEIIKLNVPGKNIRDLVMTKISESIVNCSRIAQCYFQSPFMDKLTEVVSFLYKKIPDQSPKEFLRKTLTPNLIRRYAISEMPASVTQSSPERSRLGLAANLLMLYDYYVDNELGRLVADKGAESAVAGKGFAASYNKSRQGWLKQAEQIKAIASGLYFGSKTDPERTTELTHALKHLNKIINEIRATGSSGQHSHFVNELIRIVTSFGRDLVPKIEPSEHINSDYLIKNAEYIFPHDIDQINADDYAQMHFIYHASTPFTAAKDKFNNQKWTAVSEKLPRNAAETNLNRLFAESITNRNKEIASLELQAREHAKKFLPEGDPERARIDASPKYKFDIVDLINHEMKSDIPCLSIFAPNSTIQNGQLKKPFQEARQYLAEIKKPLEPFKENAAPRSRLCC